MTGWRTDALRGNSMQKAHALGFSINKMHPRPVPNWQEYFGRGGRGQTFEDLREGSRVSHACSITMIMG
jgi:hypothetical protein